MYGILIAMYHGDYHLWSRLFGDLLSFFRLETFSSVILLKTFSVPLTWISFLSSHPITQKLGLSHRIPHFLDFCAWFFVLFSFFLDLIFSFTEVSTYLIYLVSSAWKFLFYILCSVEEAYFWGFVWLPEVHISSFVSGFYLVIFMLWVVFVILFTVCVFTDFKLNGIFLSHIALFRYFFLNLTDLLLVLWFPTFLLVFL